MQFSESIGCLRTGICRDIGRSDTSEAEDIFVHHSLDVFFNLQRVNLFVQSELVFHLVWTAGFRMELEDSIRPDGPPELSRVHDAVNRVGTF